MTFRLCVAASNAEYLQHFALRWADTNAAHAVAALSRIARKPIRNARVLLVTNGRHAYSPDVCRRLEQSIRVAGAAAVDVIDVLGADVAANADQVDFVIDACLDIDGSVTSSETRHRIAASIAARRRHVAVMPCIGVSIASGVTLHNDEPSDNRANRGSIFVCGIDAPPCVSERADATLCWTGVVRAALLSFPETERCGELVGVADVGEEEGRGMATLATRASVAALLPPRPRNGHKGTFGTALICAGSSDYWGAPLLSARGALRAGAGIVAVAVPPALRVAVASTLPEATMPSLGDSPLTHDGCLSGAAANCLLSGAAQRRVRAVLVGPGTKDAVPFLRSYLANPLAAALPLVVDADGLTALPALGAEWWRLLPRDTILTPHPGEMERLCAGDSETAVRAIGAMTCEERLRLAARCAARWRAVVLLKGAFTVIAAPDGAVCVLPFASPALAIGGSGDVLAGVIVALRCQQQVSAFDAAVVGGFLHGTAGLQLEAERGDSGVLAHELAELIPAARQRLLNAE